MAGAWRHKKQEPLYEAEPANFIPQGVYGGIVPTEENYVPPPPIDEQLYDLDQKVLSVSKRGYLVLIFLITGFFLLSSLIPIQSAVVADGKLVAEGLPKSVQHLEGGIIDVFHVKNGDKVQSGDPLLTLRSPAVRAKLERYDLERVSKIASVARLQAELNRHRFVTWPSSILEQKSDPEVSEILKNQADIFRFRRESFQNELASMDADIRSAYAEVEGLNGIIRSLEFELGSLEDELGRLKILLDARAITKPRFDKTEREYVALVGEINSHRTKQDQANEKISATQYKMEKFKSQHFQNIASDLEVERLRLQNLEGQFATAADQNSRMLITAPTDGIVHNLKYNSPNAIIIAGEEILQVIPSSDNLIAVTQVRPVDIDQVRLGQNVEVNLSSFHPTQVGRLSGEVTAISADVITDETTTEPYFEVQVTLNPNEKLESLRLTSGLPVQGYIKTEKTSLLGYLLRPISRTFDRSFKES